MFDFIFGFAVGVVTMIAISAFLYYKDKKNNKYIMIELNDHAD